MSELEESFKKNGGVFKCVKLEQLFSSLSGDTDLQKKHINSKGEYVISSGRQNYGILGKTDVNAKVLPSNTLTIDMFGNTFYRSYKYKLVTHARIFSLQPQVILSYYELLYISSILNGFLPKKFSYDNMCSWNKAKILEIPLPFKDNKISTNYMASYIKEIEAENIKEIEAYLSSNDFTLDSIKDAPSKEDLVAMLKSVQWKEFKLVELFESQTGDFDIQRKHVNGKGCFYINSGNTNSGIVGKTDVKARIFSANTLTIDMFGYVNYRNFEYKLATHNHVFSLSFKDKFNSHLGLFICSSMNFFKEIYNYNKMCSWNKIKNDSILLPISSAKQIDNEFIDNFINKVKLYLIKDLVEWNNKKLDAYKNL